MAEKDFESLVYSSLCSMGEGTKAIERLEKGVVLHSLAIFALHVVVGISNGRRSHMMLLFCKMVSFNLGILDLYFK